MKRGVRASAGKRSLGGRSSPSSRPARLALFGLSALLASGCALDASAFRDRSNLTVASPAPHATVGLPVMVSWTAADVDGVARYGVFVNQAPVPPGKPVGWVARNDEECRRRPSCPDASWLRDRGVYVTTSTMLELTVVPAPQPGARQRSDDAVQVVVVPLDSDGYRIGASAGRQLFRVSRAPQGLRR